MENRFGLKDLIQIVLLIALIVSVWLSMKQRDREFVLLQEIQQQGVEQTRDFVSIRRALQDAPRIGAGTTTQATEFGDPFRYVKEAESKPDFAQGDWLVDNFGTKVPKLTPLISSDAYAQIVQARVLESLAYQDPTTLEYLPLLARSWPRSPDGMVYTFQLRQGVTFSDGEPFTAEDIVFTYNWIMNPKVQAPRERAYYEKLASVEKNGDFEVVFKFKEPYFESLDLASGMPILPKHFYGKNTPEAFNENVGLLMGTGPYRLKNPSAWRPGDQIELVRNERYWGEPAIFDRLIFHQVETDAAELTMFKNGEVDLFGATPEQYLLLRNDQKILARTQHFEVSSPLRGYTYVAWNQSRKGQRTRFADKRIRQAMTMLTDRQRICDEVLLGYATVASGPFSALGKPQAAPGLQPWPFDPEKAKSLLKDAGFEDRNGDGVIEDSQGHPFEFKLSFPAKNETYERVILFLKDTYARAGIKMELDPLDWPIMIKRLEERDFDAISLAWTGGAETDIYQMFHSSQMKDNGDDCMSYQNPELDKLIEQARSTVDEEKRMPLWQKCSLILHEDQPYTFLYNTKSLVFIDQRIRNIGRSKLGLNYVSRFNMPNPWYVPKAQQKWTR